MKIPSLSLVDQEVAILMLTSTTGGALVDGTLIKQDITTSQGGSVTSYPNPNARIRLVGAFSQLFESDYSATAPSGANYSDSVISSNTGASQYQVVPAGTTVQTVNFSLPSSTSVPATAVSASTSCQNTLYDATNHCSASSLALGTLLAAGGDYTLLVYGVMTGASVQLLTDNNQAPTSANIRVINVVQSSGNASFDVVDLFNSSVPLFQAVQYEQTSAYTGLTTGVSHLNAQVQALQPPLSTLQPIQDGKNIALGGVYTLVVGGTDTAFTTSSAQLVLDRLSAYHSVLRL